MPAYGKLTPENYREGRDVDRKYLSKSPTQIPHAGRDGLPQSLSICRLTPQ
ncbi:MAG: hypothetical protein ACKVT0_09850 [Planctomycetaceae bacterium]